MLAWLSENLINLVLIGALAVLVGLLIRGMVRDRKAGKCACGGDCSHLRRVLPRCAARTR